MKSILKMREPVNTLTHFITFIAALGGLIILIVLSRNSLSKLVVMTIYGMSIILLYGASSIYHWVRTVPEKLLILKKLDHIAIYILIAGSYTPVLYYGLTGSWKICTLISVWLMALVGIILKLYFINIPRLVSTIFYLAFGWFALVPLWQLVRNLPLGAVVLMFVGGAAYTFGAVIYAKKCFDFIPNLFGFHELFHLFIIAGTFTHFLMMLFYIMPA